MAVAVAEPRYWQAWAVPLPVQAIDSPGSRAVLGQEMQTPWSSLTATRVSRTSPVLLTR